MTVIDQLDLSARATTERSREIRNYKGDFELREVQNGTGGTTLEFNGYACVTGVAYEMNDMFGPYEEVIDPGAFTKTLSDNCDTVFLINHDGMTLARTKSGTLKLAEDGTGLHSVAQLDASAPIIQTLRSAIDRGDLDEMSFAFRCVRQNWSPDYMQRNIQEVSLNRGDVSVVNYGANPFTADPGMSLRSLQAMRSLRTVSLREIAKAFSELRAGATLSAATTDVLQQVLDLVSGADDNVDEAQVILSDLMGVPNPDDDNADGQSVAQGEQIANDSEAKSSNLSLYQAKATALALNSKRRAVAQF